MSTTAPTEAHASRRRKRRGRRKHRRRRAAAVAVYRGRFGVEQAERLLWRAGFGPRPGEAAKLARKGLDGAVHSLTRPRNKARLGGPRPHDQDGHPLAPTDAWGHDHLWWLDRMLRTNRPLTERMTLVWHDWFATSNDGVGSERLMIQQNELLRRNALGSFRDLLVRVTRDPAMLLWLSGAQNREDSPNENYARELMELFTLGADRGYTEDDVREQARALTGFRNDWDDGVGATNFRFDPEYHDYGIKRIFGKKGRFEWRDSCEMCLAHPSHPSFFVEKLWSYFIPVPPGRRTRRALQSLYVRGRYEVRPVVEAILRHPAFYEGPRMVKPPVVYLAGLLRGSGRWLDTEAWTWLSDMMRQRLFVPPNVAGWEDDRWLDTGTWRARWLTASNVLRDREEDPGQPYDETEQPETAVERALDFWGGPTVSATTRGRLMAFSKRVAASADKPYKRRGYFASRQNALRLLVATSPDMQTS
jgi:uncharacterized protein (DUF1800 family)